MNAAGAQDTIIVYPGTYTENVDVNKEQLTITSENGAASAIVQAADSNDHVFEITADNVTIEGFTVTGATHGSGIYASDASNLNIIGNNASSNYNGIYLDNVGTVAVQNNTANSNQEGGIFAGVASYKNDCIVSGNTAKGNGENGIGVAQSQGEGECSVTDNWIEGNGSGLGYASAKGEFTGADYGHDLISGNTIIHNPEGGLAMSLGHANYITSIVDNNISYNGGGIVMSDKSGGGSVVTGNTVCHNGGPGIFGSWKNGGFSSTPYDIGILIENNTFEYNDGAGIGLMSLKNGGAIPVRNNRVNYNKGSGIILGAASDEGPNPIEDNIICFNQGMGIEMVSLSNGGLSPIARNRIESNEGLNTFYDWEGELGIGPIGGIGIASDSSGGYPITDNIINSNDGMGIYIHTSSSGSGLIQGNEIKGNQGDGVWIYHSAAGDRAIGDNLIEDNLGAGIWLGPVTTYTVSGNTCSNNAYGVYLDSPSSGDNTIYLNNFVDNGDNVYSENSTNIWHSPDEITYSYNSTHYTSYLGNHWGDYTGSDTNADGIGDTPYDIDSGKDSYPLMEPFEHYFDPWAYDENEDGIIQKMEAIKAIQDYFSGKISKAQAIEVIMLYFG